MKLRILFLALLLIVASAATAAAGCVKTVMPPTAGFTCWSEFYNCDGDRFGIIYACNGQAFQFVQF